MKVKSYTSGNFTLRLVYRPSPSFNQALLSNKIWGKVTDVWARFLSPATACGELKNIMKIPRKWEVGIELCGDFRIRNINLNFRKKNEVTDVLSFPQYSDLRKLKSSFFPNNVVTMLGDIVVCIPQTNRQAKEHGISNKLEMIYLANHGLLHLLGFDHEVSKKEENIMQEWEDHLIEKIQVNNKNLN